MILIGNLKKREIKISSPETTEKIISIIKPKLSVDLKVQQKVIDPTINVTEAEQKEGWLHKCGQNNAKWDKRWFILENGVASYYKKKEDKEPLGKFEVRGHKLIQVDIQKKKHLFSIVTPKRTWHMYADNEHEKQSWIAAMIQHGAILDVNQNK